MTIRTAILSARLRMLLLVVLLGLAGGCAKPPPPPPPTVIQATLSADAGVNPDSRGRASPIIVRVLELKTLAAFNAADFFSLWDREKETLGTELVAGEEFQLRPGDTRKFERSLPPETKYVAVVAAYRDLERATWRGAVAIAANQTQSLVIGLDARNVTISRK